MIIFNKKKTCRKAQLIMPALTSTSKVDLPKEKIVKNRKPYFQLLQTFVIQSMIYEYGNKMEM